MVHTNDVWYANGDGSGDATSVASFAAQSDVNVRQKQRKLALHANSVCCCTAVCVDGSNPTTPMGQNRYRGVPLLHGY